MKIGEKVKAQEVRPHPLIIAWGEAFKDEIDTQIEKLKSQGVLFDISDPERIEHWREQIRKER